MRAPASALSSVPRLVTLASLASLVGCASAPAPTPAPLAPPASSSSSASSSPPASASASPSASAPAPLTDTAAADDTKSSNTFTASLFARVRHTSPGNLLVSGTSVRQALDIVALGAAPSSDTEREMTTALALPTDRAQRAAAATSETAAWQAARGTAELAIANRIWTDQSFATKPDFTAAANAAFGAGVASVDFLHAPDAARLRINAWAADATSHKIENLLAPGSVLPSTRLVVTNAVYFKARWSSTFPPGATKNEPFTAAAAKTNVPMMHETSIHRFAQVGTSRVLEMRYSGSELAMVVVLPDDPSPAALAKLEDSVSSDTFDSWTTALRPHRVTVSLPRFKFESGGSLDAALQDLGMHAAFTPKADFSGIADPVGGQRLQITHVVQRTYVSVDENGTEAAAATGVVMTALSAVQAPNADFKADHPFLFFVYDSSHGAQPARGRILFAGRVSAPRP
jgi:serpin B